MQLVSVNNDTTAMKQVALQAAIILLLPMAKEVRAFENIGLPLNTRLQPTRFARA
jgi:hypothetical protein